MSDRELMQQVLEDICGARLCEVNSMSSRHEMLRLMDKAIAALRERLAQKDEPSAEPCVCGNSIKSNTEHRTDGPCYRKEPSAEPTRDDVIAFLLGEGPLDGVWFDEPHPTYKGRFWWREYLLKATEPSAEPVAYRLHKTDIYDFAGWLTTRPGLMLVGSGFDAALMAEAVGEYIRTFPERFSK